MRPIRQTHHAQSSKEAAAAALSRPFTASVALQPPSSLPDEESRQLDNGAESPPRHRSRGHRSLGPPSKEQQRIGMSLVAEDVIAGKGHAEEEEEEDEEDGALLDNVGNVSVDVDAGLRRRQAMASRSPTAGDAAADAGASAEAALIRSGDLATFRGQCNDGDSFTVTSVALPIADGCYSAVVGTSFGEGFFYSTDDVDKRLIYPKLITKDGLSQVRAHRLLPTFVTSILLCPQFSVSPPPTARQFTRDVTLPTSWTLVRHTKYLVVFS